MPLRLKRYPARSPHWYVRGTVAGIRICESTGTGDRNQAEAYRVKREGEAYSAGRLGIEKPVTFSGAVIAYSEAGGERRFMKPLLDYFKQTPLPKIGQAAIDKAAAELYPGTKASTRVRQVYTPMATVINHAAKIGLPGATYIRLEKPKVDRTPVLRANADHLERLLDQSGPNLKAWILVSSETGLRASEMIRQRRADYAVRPGWIAIGRTKNDEPALVPVTDRAAMAVAVIMPQDDQTPVFGFHTVQGVNAALRRAAKRAGLPYLSSHQIGRHTFAGRILDAGYGIKVLKEAGRWKKLAVVDERYGHMEISTVHDIMRKVAENKS